MDYTLKTARDKKILELFACGMSFAEIVARPEVSASRTHVSNVVSRFVGAARKSMTNTN